MDINKILRNIQGKTKAKKNTIEYELEILKKENYTENELECQIKCCQIRLQESYDSKSYVLVIAALLLSIVGNIASIFSFLGEGNNGGEILMLQGALLFVLIIAGSYVAYMIHRINKVKENDLLLQNKMIACELLLAEKKRKEKH